MGGGLHDRHARRGSPREGAGLLRQGWPYGGRYRRDGNEVVCSVAVPRGCLGALLDQFMLAPAQTVHTTRLTAYPVGRRTALVVASDLPAHAGALEAFLREDLNAKRG